MYICCIHTGYPVYQNALHWVSGNSLRHYITASCVHEHSLLCCNNELRSGQWSKGLTHNVDEQSLFLFPQYRCLPQVSQRFVLRWRYRQQALLTVNRQLWPIKSYHRLASECIIGYKQGSKVKWSRKIAVFHLASNPGPCFISLGFPS